MLETHHSPTIGQVYGTGKAIRLRRLPLVVLLIVVFLALGYAPFRVDLPHQVSHGGTWTTSSGGERIFATDGENPARIGGDGWIDAMRGAEEFELAFTVWTDQLDQQGVIFASGPSLDNHNLLMAQDGDSLLLRIRSDKFPISEDLPGVFTEVGSRRIVLRRANEAISVRSGGEEFHSRTLTDSNVGRWNPNYATYVGGAGDGDSGWSGTFGEISVDIDGDVIDLTESLDGSGSHFYFPELPSQLEVDSTVVVDFFRNFLGFAPLGAALAYFLRSKGPWPATMLAFVVSLAIELGQVFIPERFAHVIDVVLNTAGAFTGAMVLLWFRRRWRAKHPADGDGGKHQRPAPVGAMPVSAASGRR